MRRHKRRQLLSLEVLEDRCVPATIQFTSGVLQITGQSGSLTLTQTANNAFTIVDGAKSPVKVTGVSSIHVTGSTVNGNLTVNLGTFTYSGSLTSTTTNGNGTTIDIEANGGSELGNVIIVHQNGSSTVDIDSTGTGALTLRGTLQVTNTTGNNTANFGNSSASLTVLGTVTLTAANTVTLNSTTGLTFGSDFTDSLGSNTGFLNLQQIGGASNPITFGGNVTLNGGIQNDFVELDAANISKNLTMNLGAAAGGSLGIVANELNLSVSPTELVTVGGNFTYTGTGPDQLDLSGTDFNGNVNLNLGSGSAEVALDDFAGQTYINGNLTVHDTGDLDFTTINGFTSGGIQAIIGGSASFFLGNGNSIIPFEGTGSVGGQIIIEAGNGDNQVSFLGPQVYDLFAVLGNGDNTVTLNNAGAILTGYLQGGSGNNMFNQVAGQVVNFTITGF